MVCSDVAVCVAVKRTVLPLYIEDGIDIFFIILIIE